MGHLEVIQLLIEKGANINAVDNNEQTPLYWAAERGKLEVIKLLIEKDVNINTAGKDANAIINLYMAV